METMRKLKRGPPKGKKQKSINKSIYFIQERNQKL